MLGTKQRLIYPLCVDKVTYALFWPLYTILVYKYGTVRYKWAGVRYGTVQDGPNHPYKNVSATATLI